MLVKIFFSTIIAVITEEKKLPDYFYPLGK